MKRLCNLMPTVRNVGFVLTLALISVLGARSAQASLETYTFSGIGSGTVGSTAFTDAAFTFTFTPPTSQTSSFTPGQAETSEGSADVSIAGFGSGETTGTPIVVFNNQEFDLVGLNDIATDVYDAQAPVLSSYVLGDNIGPISVNETLGNPLSTTLGDITITSTSDGTFTATPAAVPEASSVAGFALLLVLGTFGLMSSAKRKRSMPVA